jgi:hypothetical protein
MFQICSGEARGLAAKRRDGERGRDPQPSPRQKFAGVVAGVGALIHCFALMGGLSRRMAIADDDLPEAR